MSPCGVPPGLDWFHVRLPGEHLALFAYAPVLGVVTGSNGDFRFPEATQKKKARRLPARSLPDDLDYCTTSTKLVLCDSEPLVAVTFTV